jgi:hypothetical protein
VTRKIIALAAAIGIASFAVPASAANPGYCEHYASQAVWQFHRNESIPGCFHGANARWNANWAGHYNWCLGAPFEAARAEDSYRGARLHECMAAAGQY